MLMVTIRPHCRMTTEIKNVATLTNVKMVTPNAVTIRFARILKVRITAVVGKDSAEIHRRRIVNRWRECVPMERFVIEMLRWD